MKIIIIGIDEVNYSPSICGDTIVCACLFVKKPPRSVMIKDSKKMTHKQRVKTFAWLQEHSVYTVEVAAVNHIQYVGIYSARNLAMVRAGRGLMEVMRYSLPSQEFKVIVDGGDVDMIKRLWPWYGAQLEFKVRADETIPEVSAASIIARVYADALFEGWEVNWPGYGMNSDHGSIAQGHKLKLREAGPTPIHRTKNYAPKWWPNILGRTDEAQDDSS